MQALSAASRYSCGLAKRFEPPSSQGSSMSIVKRRFTSSPLMPKPSTWLRLPVWPCQVVATCQRVMPLAGSSLTLSISEKIVDVDAVDDFRRRGHCVAVHDGSP